MGYYVTPSGVSALKAYKYSGADLSLTYKYILSPFAQACVDWFTPLWVAPNTITGLGLLWMVAAYLIMLFYAPTFSEGLVASTLNIPGEVPEESGAVPRWVYLFNAFAMVIYQTLDNMDGKQARRTGSSSPLGMLFDHGCDAINSPMGSINWCVAMAIGPSIPLVLFWTLIASAIPFYISTWEEYYTGALVLPIINGPSEGLLLGASLSVVSYVSGPQFWHSYTFSDAGVSAAGVSAALAAATEYVPAIAEYVPAITDTIAEYVPATGFRNYELCIMLAALCAIQEMSLKTASVVYKYGLSPLGNLLPFLSLLSCCVFCHIQQPSLVANNPRFCMLLFGLNFVEMVCGLMLDHMLHKPFKKIRSSMIPFYALAATLWFSNNVTPVITSSGAETFLHMYLAGAASHLAFKLAVVVEEICEALDIWCFDIVTPRGTRANKKKGQ